MAKRQHLQTTRNSVVKKVKLNLFKHGDFKCVGAKMWSLANRIDLGYVRNWVLSFKRRPLYPQGTIGSWSWGSSVSTEADYTLDDRGSIPAEENDFSSSLCVQTSSEAHPASYPMSTGVKRGRLVRLTTHLVPRPRMSRSYTSSPS
jgi:hypothetical protein